jgi:hypothetical protein
MAGRGKTTSNYPANFDIYHQTQSMRCHGVGEEGAGMKRTNRLPGWGWNGQGAKDDGPSDDRATRAVEHLISQTAVLPCQMHRPTVWTGEQRLAAAQIELAIHDLTGGDGPLTKRRQDYDTARVWAAAVDQADQYLSLEWACGLLNLDVGLVRKGLLALRYEERGWNSHGWSEADDVTLTTTWGHIPYTETSRRLKRSLDSVRHRAACLGLPGRRQLRRSAVAA